MTSGDMPAPARPDAPASGDEQTCPCSRRAVLKGLGCLAAALPLGAAGCAASGSPIDNASASMCGANMCVNLNDPANAALTKVGGVLTLDAPDGSPLVLIRSATSSVTALSAVCTHRGCTVEFDSSQRIFVCPCHGSEFSETGSVINGPAQRPLPKYSATLANNEITVKPG
jgi:cytochrome b6-f complex iron-sulfur subunit